MEEREGEAVLRPFYELGKKAGLAVGLTAGRWKLTSDQSELGKTLVSLAKNFVDESGQCPSAYSTENPRHIRWLAELWSQFRSDGLIGDTEKPLLDTLARFAQDLCPVVPISEPPAPAAPAGAAAKTPLLLLGADTWENGSKLDFSLYEIKPNGRENFFAELKQPSEPLPGHGEETLRQMHLKRWDLYLKLSIKMCLYRGRIMLIDSKTAVVSCVVRGCARRAACLLFLA